MWCENYLKESSLPEINFSSQRIDTIKQRIDTIKQRIDTIKQRIGAIFNIVHTNKQKSTRFGLAEQF